jgi:type III pantothenate kinase
MGTATKMIVTNKNGAFTGVSIIPGVMMGLNALASGTAQLPQISLEAPPTVIGKNTVDCMKSGVIFGNASMIDGMVNRINREVGEELPVIVTGGYADAIAPHCEHKMTLDKNLVLKGLNIIYHKNKN